MTSTAVRQIPTEVLGIITGVESDDIPKPANRHAATLTAAEMGAVAHLYRGEVYRSTIWRTRLDTTTNWAVVTTGVALSVSFSSPSASSLPLLLVGPIVFVFLLFEGRRYRYFNVWRARARLMETDFYAPMLSGCGCTLDGEWNLMLAGDYRKPLFHISICRAIGRRLRKNYAYIFLMQLLAYYGKLIVHPGPLQNADDLIGRAAIGPIPGEFVIFAGVVFHGVWVCFAIGTFSIELRARRDSRSLITIA